MAAAGPDITCEQHSGAKKNCFSPSALKNLCRSLPHKNPLMCPSLNQTLAEAMEFPQVSKTNQGLPLGLGRGSASSEEQGSLVPEQNQGSVSKKGGQ